jgi:hypothetical protein
MLRFLAFVVFVALFTVVARAAGFLFRGVTRVLMSLSIALAGGLLAGQVGALYGLDEIVVSLAAALLLFPLILRLGRRSEERRRLRRAKAAMRDGGRAAPPAPAAASGDPQVDAALADVEPMLDWAHGRIAVLRGSYGRLFRHAAANPTDSATVEWAVVMRGQVPGLVRAALAEQGSASPSERRQLLEDLLDSLERLAAEAERRLSDARALGTSDFAIRREHIARRTGRDEL